MEFWSAEQLKEEFDTIASFYQVELDNRMVMCRDHALIVMQIKSSQMQS